MFERFTERGRKVMAIANKEVQRWGHECIGTEHILLGLIKVGDCRGVSILGECGVDVRDMAGEIERLFKLAGRGDDTHDAAMKSTPRARNVIQHAIEESRLLQHGYIGTEHILLGLLRESEGVASEVLAHLGVTLDAVRSIIE